LCLLLLFDMCVGQMKVIVWAVNVSGYNRRVLSSVLCCVRSVEDIEHAFGIGISFIGRVWWTGMYHGFIDGGSRLANFIWKDTCGETGDKFLDTCRMSAFINVEGHAHVSVEKIGTGGHVVP